MSDLVPARWWRVASADPPRVACDLCPRGCVLGPDRRGWCGARTASPDGTALLARVGRASGLAVDPFEKKPLFHVLPGRSVLSFGTTGCTLGCRWCQNHPLSRSPAPPRVPASPDAIAEAALREGCGGVAFTYNEPVVFLEYALEVAEACRARGLRTVAVTNGWISDAARPDLLAGMDALNVDLKAFSDDTYRTLCDGSLAPVLDTLGAAVRAGIWVEVTTLLIPGINDADAEIEAECAWLADTLGPDVPLHLSAFHPDHRLLDRPRTPPATLHRAAAIARRHGLRYVYTGNVADPEGQSTRCPGTPERPCGALLVERAGFRARVTGLDDGRCRACGAAIPGLWR